MQVRRADVDVGTGSNRNRGFIFRFWMAFADDRSAGLEHSDRSTMHEHAEYDEKVIDGEDDFSEMLTIGRVG
jgi:hypothetical protein